METTEKETLPVQPADNQDSSGQEMIGSPLSAGVSGTDSMIPPFSPPTSVSVAPLPSSPKKNKVLTIVLAIALPLVVAGAGIAAYRFIRQAYANPQKVVTASFEKLAEADSFSAKVEFSGNQAWLETTYHRAEEKLSRVRLVANDVDDDPGKDLEANLIIGGNDLYFRLAYSQINQVVDQLKAVYPPLVETETYKLLLPVFSGQTWLHADISGLGETEDQEGTEQEIEGPISQEDQRELGKIFREAILVRQHDRNFSYQEEKYQRIVFGFKKQKLVESLEKLKDLDLEMKVSQINSLIELVEGIDNWDADLIEVLINAEGYPALVSLSLPEISEKDLSESLEEGLEEESSLWGSLLGSYAPKLGEALSGKEKGQLEKMGTLKLTNFNQAPAVEKPSAIVESEEVLEKAKVELLPLFGAMLGGLGGVPLPEGGGAGLPLPPQFGQ